MPTNFFSVPVFLVVFREALETVIIVSVLLAFLKQTLANDSHEHSNPKLHNKLTRQVWLGTLLGFLVCLVVGAALIGVFYTVGVNNWELSELDYEGAFCLIASVIITVVGAALLRINKMQDKWRVKLAAAMEEKDRTTTTTTQQQQGSVSAASEGGGNNEEKRSKFIGGGVKRFLAQHAMFVLPFVTVLREGIEAIVFVAGVTFSAPASAVPLPVVVGLLVGVGVGYVIYK